MLKCVRASEVPAPRGKNLKRARLWIRGSASCQLAAQAHWIGRRQDYGALPCLSDVVRTYVRTRLLDLGSVLASSLLVSASRLPSVRLAAAIKTTQLDRP